MATKKKISALRAVITYNLRVLSLKWGLMVNGQTGNVYVKTPIQF